MEVTSFFPEVYVKDIEKTAAEYVNDFGFELRHKQENGESKYYILKSKSGDRVALVSFPDDNLKEGLYAMRINVRDIHEGVDYFVVRGYRNPGSVERGGLADIHGKARYELMVSPDGSRVDVVEHFRDEQ